MTRTLPALLLTLAALSPAPVLGAEVTAPHVRVTYEGITDKQAEAVAQTLSAAREAYEKHFGFDMPDEIRCSVECGPGKASRLYTDGEDRVFLSMPSADKLLRPAKSGTFPLYGLCHELGHIAMYRILEERAWMTTAAAEGWAHYAGSVVVDEVFKACGEKLWTPDPYDYRADGTARLEKQLKDQAPSDVAKGAGEWKRLGAIVGPTGFKKVFEALQEGQPGDAAIPAGASTLVEVLTRADSGKSNELKKWWTGAAPILFEATEASDFGKAGIDRSKLEHRPVKLEFDDDAPDGKKSIAGGGHARRFHAPGGGKWYLTAVSVHGARYGAANPPASATFDVALCDAQMRPVAVWKHPYRLFERGKSKWVRIELPPTRVPPGGDGFYVALDFRPTATQGVYVSLDESSKGTDKSGSLVATPGKPGEPPAGGDWMVRAELDRPKAADALK
jgi:hypothetical protein